MAGELESVVRELFGTFDRKDFDALQRMFTDDVQGVDELSRRWMRGRDAAADYFRQFGPIIDDLRSEITEVHETVWGDVGIVTAWGEQDYKLQGQQQHISAPITVVLRRSGGAWRVALIHAVPLPEAPS